MPVLAINAPQRGVSDFEYSASCAGVPPPRMAPCESSLSRVAGSSSNFWISEFSWADYRRGRACWGQQLVPGRGLEAGIGFADRWHVGCAAHALERGHGQELELAVVDEALGLLQAVEQQVDLAAEQVVERGAVALVV